MAAEILWEGHRIQIETRLAGRYVWLATETRVLVDGQEAARSGGFGLTEHASGQFRHGDRMVPLELEIRPGWFSWYDEKYKIRIAGQVVSQGEQNITRSGASYLLSGLLVGLIACCAMFILLRMLGSP